jgi:hypothetical protein
VLKEGVIRAVQTFFQTGKMQPGVNKMAIVLIPKIDGPQLPEIAKGL